MAGEANVSIGCKFGFLKVIYACSNKPCARNNLFLCKCEFCGREVLLNKGELLSRFKKYGDLTYCKCLYVKPGSRKETSNGYIVISAPHHPNSNSGKILEHRYNMTLKLRRPLEHNETVHHMYGDKKDNNVDHLALWLTPHPSGIDSKDNLEKLMNTVSSYLSIYKTEIKEYCKKILISC